MKVTCPKGHEVEIMDPKPSTGLVGVDEDGVEYEGEIEHDLVTVQCSAPLDPSDPKKGLCGKQFAVDLTG